MKKNIMKKPSLKTQCFSIRNRRIQAYMGGSLIGRHAVGTIREESLRRTLLSNVILFGGKCDF